MVALRRPMGSVHDEEVGGGADVAAGQSEGMADQIALPTEPLEEFTRDKDGHIWRRFGEHRIAHVDLILYERVRPCDVSVTSSERPVTGEPATAAEWSEALAKAVKYLRERDSKESARQDAESFGVRTTSKRRTDHEKEEIVVRVTRTQVATIDGGPWSRRTGYRIGQGRDLWAPKLRLAPVEEAAAGRERVDFVAERKAASGKARGA
jgi:hypothetical protein